MSNSTRASPISCVKDTPVVRKAPHQKKMVMFNNQNVVIEISPEELEKNWEDVVIIEERHSGVERDAEVVEKGLKETSQKVETVIKGPLKKESSYNSSLEKAAPKKNTKKNKPNYWLLSEIIGANIVIACCMLLVLYGTGPLFNVQEIVHLSSGALTGTICVIVYGSIFCGYCCKKAVNEKAVNEKLKKQKAAIEKQKAAIEEQKAAIEEQKAAIEKKEEIYSELKQQQQSLLDQKEKIKLDISEFIDARKSFEETIEYQNKKQDKETAEKQLKELESDKLCLRVEIKNLKQNLNDNCSELVNSNTEKLKKIENQICLKRIELKKKENDLQAYYTGLKDQEALLEQKYLELFCCVNEKLEEINNKLLGQQYDYNEIIKKILSKIHTINLNLAKLE